MEGREEVIIQPGMHGIILYAECKHPVEGWGDWIILVADVRMRIDGNLAIFRYVSHSIKNGAGDADPRQVNWGLANDYRFYKAKEDEKKIILDKIKKKGFKYVKIINKLIYR